MDALQGALQGMQDDLREIELYTGRDGNVIFEEIQAFVRGRVKTGSDEGMISHTSVFIMWLLQAFPPRPD